MFGQVRAVLEQGGFKASGEDGTHLLHEWTNSLHCVQEQDLRQKVRCIKNCLKHARKGQCRLTVNAHVLVLHRLVSIRLKRFELEYAQFCS